MIMQSIRIKMLHPYTMNTSAFGTNSQQINQKTTYMQIHISGHHFKYINPKLAWALKSIPYIFTYPHKPLGIA